METDMQARIAYGHGSADGGAVPGFGHGYGYGYGPQANGQYHGNGNGEGNPGNPLMKNEARGDGEQRPQA